MEDVITRSKTTTNRKGVISMAKHATETTKDFVTRLIKLATIVAPILIAIYLIQSVGAPSAEQVAAIVLVQLAAVAGYRFIK